MRYCAANLADSQRCLDTTYFLERRFGSLGGSPQDLSALGMVSFVWMGVEDSWMGRVFIVTGNTNELALLASWFSDAAHA